jgi:hypothetical protein
MLLYWSWGSAELTNMIAGPSLLRLYVCVDALHILFMKAVWTHEDKDSLLHITGVPVKWVQMHSEAEG